jgi:hypothetical protein
LTAVATLGPDPQPWLLSNPLGCINALICRVRLNLLLLGEPPGGCNTLGVMAGELKSGGELCATRSCCE